MENKYDDIINLPHYEPQKHARMSIKARSAQFAPFSALTGYEEAVIETGRITQNKIELSEEQKLNINSKLKKIIEGSNKEVTITYFVKDKRKSGGKYIEINGTIKKIDEIKQEILLTNNEKIDIQNIINISSEIIDI